MSFAIGARVHGFAPMAFLVCLTEFPLTQRGPQQTPWPSAIGVHMSSSNCPSQPGSQRMVESGVPAHGFVGFVGGDFSPACLTVSFGLVGLVGFVGFFFVCGAVTIGTCLLVRFLAAGFLAAGFLGSGSLETVVISS